MFHLPPQWTHKAPREGKLGTVPPFAASAVTRAPHVPSHGCHPRRPRVWALPLRLLCGFLCFPLRLPILLDTTEAAVTWDRGQVPWTSPGRPDGATRRADQLGSQRLAT